MRVGFALGGVSRAHSVEMFFIFSSCLDLSLCGGPDCTFSSFWLVGSTDLLHDWTGDAIDLVSEK